MACASRCVAVIDKSSFRGLFSVVETSHGWVRRAMPTPHVRPADSFQGVDMSGLSCASMSFCVAVGTNQCNGPLIERFNGKAWRVVTVNSENCKTGGMLTGVSCVSASACLAVGYPPLVWNGRRWRTLKLAGWAERVWCVAPRRCALVGSDSAGSHVGVWDGRRTQGRLWDASYYREDSSMNDVSCMSKTACLAVGNLTESGDMAAFDGRTWREATPPDSLAGPLIPFESVACTARICVMLSPGDATEELNRK